MGGMDAGRFAEGADGGGGSTGGRGSGFKTSEISFRNMRSSSIPSCALGTMSDRNSRSSEESAKEL